MSPVGLAMVTPAGKLSVKSVVRVVDVLGVLLAANKVICRVLVPPDVMLAGRKLFLT